jgi:thymidylate kinase
MRGLFINFEGIDKSGKGTQIELLKQKMAADGYPFLVSSEPTHSSEAGRYIWQILRKEIPAPASLNLQLNIRGIVKRTSRLLLA